MSTIKLTISFHLPDCKNFARAKNATPANIAFNPVGVLPTKSFIPFPRPFVLFAIFSKITIRLMNVYMKHKSKK